MKLSKERDNLAFTAKKLGRDLAKVILFFNFPFFYSLMDHVFYLYVYALAFLSLFWSILFYFNFWGLLTIGDLDDQFTSRLVKQFSFYCDIKVTLAKLTIIKILKRKKHPF